MINGVHSPCSLTAEESPWKPCGFDSAEQQETAEEDRWGTPPESDQQEASKKQPQRGSHEISSLFLKERFVGHGHGPGAMGYYIYILLIILGYYRMMKWYQRLGKSMSSFDKNSKEPSPADAWVWIGIRTRAALRVQKVRARPIPSKKCHENWNRLGEALPRNHWHLQISLPPRKTNYGNMKETQRERERGQARDGLDT